MLLTCSTFLAAAGLKGTGFSCVFSAGIGAGLGCTVVVCAVDGGGGGVMAGTGSCRGTAEPVAGA